jgi:hypothetical protein
MIPRPSSSGFQWTQFGRSKSSKSRLSASMALEAGSPGLERWVGSPRSQTLNETYGLRVRSPGAFVACRPLSKSCIIPGQQHDSASQDLSASFVVLCRARVEIVSRPTSGEGPSRCTVLARLQEAPQHGAEQGVGDDRHQCRLSSVIQSQQPRRLQGVAAGWTRAFRCHSRMDPR